MTKIVNVAELKRKKVFPKGPFGVTGIVSSVEGPHKRSENVDWRLSIRLSWFSGKDEEIPIEEHVHLWIWTPSNSDESSYFDFSKIPQVRPGDFLIAFPVGVKKSSNGSFCIQLSGRSTSSRVMMVTPFDRSRDWRNFRMISSVNPQLFPRFFHKNISKHIDELKSMPTNLVEKFHDKYEIFGLIMSVAIIWDPCLQLTEAMEIVLTLYVDGNSPSWQDIPKDMFAGQNAILLGDDMTKLFPNSFQNFRQVVLRKASAQSAIAQLVQPGKFISFTGTRMSPAYDFTNDEISETACISDLSLPNSSLLVLDETYSSGIDLLKQLRRDDNDSLYR